ncbi:hypothetical protein KDL21_19375 [Pseudomonas syringae pv. syringae]|uniref:hypothetical protein n=1 Tax=Pseudomonas syringae TaxID=317 RepID=UPI0023422E9B|nr:hypothetical protein [Pseudomonas syringae]MDC3743191.1 hypothetical protein [Pseudomonas syringae pv. syringae]
MTEHASHIKNPLTVISRFAAIAEVSGSIVLPFVESENQAMFIWFLMLFPVLIVTLFFATLNFNHKKLYAPSDYKNENHFMALFGTVSVAERKEKLEEEVDEAILDAEAEDSAADPTNTTSSSPEIFTQDSPDAASKPDESSGEGNNENTTKPTQENGKPVGEPIINEHNDFDFKKFAEESKLQHMQQLKDMETMAIHKLTRECHAPFLSNVKIEIPSIPRPLIFDAIANTPDTVHLAEIKYFSKSYTPNRFLDTIRNAELAAQNIKDVSDKKVSLHLVVILDDHMNGITGQAVKLNLTRLSKRPHFTTHVYVTTVHDLKNLSLSLQSWFITS